MGRRTHGHEASAEPGLAPVLDGRRARGERARAGVVDALLSLFREGDLDPPAPRIAKRAGVSLRLLYHHFSDLEALFDEVARRQIERVADLVQPISTALPLEDRVALLCDQRAQVLELLTPVRRAALLHEPFSPPLRERLQAVRAVKRAQVAGLFAAELAAHDEPARGQLAAALGMVASWSSWESLRDHQGLSVDQARDVMARALLALLAPPGG